MEGGPSVFGGQDSGLDCGNGLTESCANHFNASRIRTSHELNSGQLAMSRYQD